MNAAEAACGIVSQREIFEGEAPRGNDDRHWTMCPRKDISSFQIAGHKKAPRSNRQKDRLKLGVTQMYKCTCPCCGHYLRSPFEPSTRSTADATDSPHLANKIPAQVSGPREDPDRSNTS